jgi:prepilin-type N-terminal cleavage/methylation domain-containing protein
MRMYSRLAALTSRAFTLVEILIVVVLLGILASIAVPQFANATGDAQINATHDQLIKIRRALEVYYVRNNNKYPTVTAGDGTWGEIAEMGNTYLREKPLNQWVGGGNAGTVVFGTEPDTAFTLEYGWIYDAATGNVWAAGHNASGQPYPRN